MGEWQPIETAPKDGAIILVFGDMEIGTGAPITGTFIASWDADFNEFNDEELYAIKPASHWMPLPDSLKAGSGFQHVSTYPNDETPVLICCLTENPEKPDEMFIGIASADDDGWYEDDGEEVEGVTHWMPLPKPPAE